MTFVRNREDLIEATNKLFDEYDKKLNCASLIPITFKDIVLDDDLRRIVYKCKVTPMDIFHSQSIYGSKSNLLSNDKCLENYNSFSDTLKSIKASITQSHELNIPNIEHNKLVIANTIQYMENIGIKQNFSTWEYKTSRSSNKVEMKREAGFKSDIRRCIKIDDGYDTLIKDINVAIKSLNETFNKVTIQIREIERAQKFKTKQAMQQKIKHAMEFKYDLGETKDLNEVLDLLVEDNKYLSLGHAVIQTIKYSDEGFYIIKNALKDFIIESPKDQEIYDDLQHIIDRDADDPDGTAFHHAVYSGEYIINMADPNIVKDYFKIKETMQID